MTYKLTGDFSADTEAPVTVSLRCPVCRQQGTFESLHGVADLWHHDSSTGFGQRRCPNPRCNAHVFAVFNTSALLGSYPPERLDFDTAAIPTRIATSLEEAIACHAASCYTAAAIMVRKTLEELCTEKAAEGSNLYKRIENLKTKVVLPGELFNGMQHLRLLGNDAAHIESQTYSQVGREEVEVGILFAKELLKAVYQYAVLVERLYALQVKPK